jgi:hypothetical protein
MSERHICDACLQSEYEEYRHARVHEFMEKNDSWQERFEIDACPRWDFNDETSQITFSKDGRSIAIADVVITGTVGKGGTQWEWSWGNVKMPDKWRIPMNSVREFGEEKQWPTLTDLFLDSDEFLGWELSSIAAHILGAEAVYRFPYTDSGNFVYLAVMRTRFAD